MTPSPPATARLRCVILLVCVPLLMTGGLDAHAGHGAGESQSEIFSDARHAGQPRHWEAADSSRVRRCPACLVPAKVDGLTPARAARTRPLTGDPAFGEAAIEPRDPAAGRRGRPRAPPVS